MVFVAKPNQSWAQHCHKIKQKTEPKECKVSRHSWFAETFAAIVSDNSLLRLHWAPRQVITTGGAPEHVDKPKLDFSNAVLFLHSDPPRCVVLCKYCTESNSHSAAVRALECACEWVCFLTQVSALSVCVCVCVWKRSWLGLRNHHVPGCLEPAAR